MDLLKKIDCYFESILKWGVVIVFSLMCLLSMVAIISRWFQMSLLWIDPVIRHLILIICFLGCSLAIGENKNIKIELLSKKIKSKYVSILSKLICSVTCFILFKGAYEFFQTEMKYGRVELLGLHSSALVSIVPIGFLFLAFRYLTTLFISSEESQ